MQTAIVVMMIWVGGHNGGATTIPGFHSLQACQAAIEHVIQQAATVAPIRTRGVCIEVSAK